MPSPVVSRYGVLLLLVDPGLVWSGLVWSNLGFDARQQGGRQLAKAAKAGKHEGTNGTEVPRRVATLGEIQWYSVPSQTLSGVCSK